MMEFCLEGLVAALFLGFLRVCTAQPFNAQTTKYPYYGKYVGRLSNPDYGLDGIVWVASETQLQVTDFSFVPPVFRRPNASFWVGPLTLTDNPRADAYPSKNGLYIAPLAMKNDAPLLNVFRQPNVQVAHRPTPEQVASIIIGNSGEKGDANAAGGTAGSAEPLAEPAADHAEADHGSIPEPEPGPLPRPQPKAKEAKFGAGSSQEEPTVIEGEKGGTIRSTHIRYSPQRATSKDGQQADSTWTQLVAAYPRAESGPIDVEVKGQAEDKTQNNQDPEEGEIEGRRTIIEEVPIRGRRNAELVDFIREAMIVGSSAVSSQLDVRSKQEGTAVPEGASSQSSGETNAKIDINTEPEHQPGILAAAQNNIAKQELGPLDLIGRPEIPVQRCPFPIDMNDTEKDLIRVKHDAGEKAKCRDGPVQTIYKEDKILELNKTGRQEAKETPAEKTSENIDSETHVMLPLHATLRQHFVLDLPEGKTIQDYKWLAIFDHSSNTALSAVTLPQSRRSSMPKSVMLKGFKPALRKRVNSTGIEIVDMKTIRIKNFFFEGDAPGAWFAVSRSIMPGLGGRLIPILRDDGTFDCDFLQPYDGTRDVTLKLPGDMDIRDVFNLSVYCVPYSISFAHVYLPYKDLVVPPDTSGVEVPYCVLE